MWLELGKFLMTQGPFAVLCGYLAWRNWDLQKRLRQLEDARFNDLRHHVESLSTLQSAMGTFKSEIRGKLDSIKEAIIQKR